MFHIFPFIQTPLGRDTYFIKGHVVCQSGACLRQIFLAALIAYHPQGPTFHLLKGKHLEFVIQFRNHTIF